MGKARGGEVCCGAIWCDVTSYALSYDEASELVRCAGSPAGVGPCRLFHTCDIVADESSPYMLHVVRPQSGGAGIEVPLQQDRTCVAGQTCSVGAMYGHLLSKDRACSGRARMWLRACACTRACKSAPLLVLVRAPRLLQEDAFMVLETCGVASSEVDVLASGIPASAVGNVRPSSSSQTRIRSGWGLGVRTHRGISKCRDANLAWQIWVDRRMTAHAFRLHVHPLGQV